MHIPQGKYPGGSPWRGYHFLQVFYRSHVVTCKLIVLQHQGTIAARARERPRDGVSQESTIPPLPMSVVSSTVLCRLHYGGALSGLRYERKTLTDFDCGMALERVGVLVFRSVGERPRGEVGKPKEGQCFSSDWGNEFPFLTMRSCC
jgi:hypothetical protein